MKTCFIVLLAAVIFCCLPAAAVAQTTGGTGVLDSINSQFTTSTRQWETSIKGHAVALFWILASIAAAWTFMLLVLKQADFAELFGAPLPGSCLSRFSSFGFSITDPSSRRKLCNQPSRSAMMPRVLRGLTGAHLLRPAWTFS